MTFSITPYTEFAIMARQYRAFTEDFVTHMNQHGWPPIKTVQSRFEDETQGFKHENYTRLKKGDGVIEKYAHGLVRIMLNDARATKPQHYGAAFAQYLRTRGLSHDSASFDAMLECVCEPARRSAWVKDVGDDLLKLGAEGIIGVVDTKRLLARHLRLCKNEAEVRTTIEWMFVFVGRSIAGELTSAEAARVATQYMRTTPDEYCRRALEWWRFNPWTIVLAQGKRRSVGVSILLPLSQRGYDAILDGEQMTYETTTEQMTAPSPLLLHEIIAERPRDMGAEELGIEDVTRALYATVVAQCGVFTHRLSGETDAIRLLSFPGTPTNQERLRGFGYVSTGKQMPGTGLEYHEKSWPWSATNSHVSLLVALIRQYGAVMDAAKDS